MGNPNPKISEKFLKLTRPIAPVPGNEPLAAKPVAVRIGVSVYDSVNRLSKADRVGWLRRVITEAAQRELMGNAPQASLDSSTNVEMGLNPGSSGDGVAAPKRRGGKPKGETHE